LFPITRGSGASHDGGARRAVPDRLSLRQGTRSLARCRHRTMPAVARPARL